MAGEARAYTQLDETIEGYLETVDAGHSALQQLRDVRQAVEDGIPAINALPYPQAVKDDCVAEALALRDAIGGFWDEIKP